MERVVCGGVGDVAAEEDGGGARTEALDALADSALVWLTEDDVLAGEGGEVAEHIVVVTLGFGEPVEVGEPCDRGVEVRDGEEDAPDTGERRAVEGAVGDAILAGRPIGDDERERGVGTAEEADVPLGDAAVGLAAFVDRPANGDVVADRALELAVNAPGVDAPRAGAGVGVAEGGPVAVVRVGTGGGEQFERGAVREDDHRRLCPGLDVFAAVLRGESGVLEALDERVEVGAGERDGVDDGAHTVVSPSPGIGGVAAVEAKGYLRAAAACSDMPTSSSAPGKVYLFGEHAVVYGEPAVPCAIERRATVTVGERADDRQRVSAADLTLDGFTVEYGADDATPDVDVPTPLVEAAMGYVDAAMATARDAADRPDAGLDVTIESEIPLGAGLGSSAAVVVAAIDAATRELGVDLASEDVAERAYAVEKEVQSGEASRADTFCSAMGGAVRVEGSDCRTLATPDLPFVVGYDGTSHDTGELVAGVRALREEYDFAYDTVESIGDLVRRGEDALREGDTAELGRLMDVNHGLLAALGVSARSLDEMVWAAREGGATGAKLTGAGGGGCIVALADGDGAKTALSLTPACDESFRAKLATEGVRAE